jgi:hypothetical protein
VRVPRPQHRRDQILFRLLVKAQKAHHRQIAVAVIVMIEEGQLFPIFFLAATKLSLAIT